LFEGINKKKKSLALLKNIDVSKNGQNYGTLNYLSLMNVHISIFLKLQSKML